MSKYDLLIVGTVLYGRTVTDVVKRHRKKCWRLTDKSIL